HLEPMLELATVVEQILSSNKLRPDTTSFRPPWWTAVYPLSHADDTSRTAGPADTLSTDVWPADMREWSTRLSYSSAVVMPGHLPADTPSELTAQWCPVDLESSPPATLLLRRGGRWPAFVLESRYQHGVRLRRTINADDQSAPLIVTLMDYPDDEKYNLLCMVWLRRVQSLAPSGSSFLILTTQGLPTPVRDYAKRYSNVEVRRTSRRPLSGFDHYNLSVKLPALAGIDRPFLFLDADMAVISPLDTLWQKRHYKPWIGVDDQASQIGFSAPFAHLNSGMQLVSEPAFYDYDAMVACFDGHGRNFLVNGEDQSLLFDYFRTIGYDYHHPQIDEGWNCCSRYARLSRRDNGEWQAESAGLPRHYPAHIIHYFNGACRPWNMRCPLYAEEESRFKHDDIPLSRKKPPAAIRAGESGSNAVLRLCLVNTLPDYIKSPGSHPFYPLTHWKIELVSDPERADIIFWALDTADPKPDYRKLTFQHNALFKKYERRFMLFSTVARPGILYLNDAFSCTPFPVYDRARNLISNVISVPWLYDGVSSAIALDTDRIQTGQSAAKTCDLIFHRHLEALVQSGLRQVGAFRCETMELERGAQPDTVERELKRLATARYYLHCHTETRAPLLLYHALSLGVIPIILNMPDLPYSETVDWRSFSLFPEPGRTLDDLVTAAESNFAVMRRNAIAFAVEYVLPPRANEQLLTLFLNRAQPEPGHPDHREKT
ncbi:MAG: hypothetical protein WCN95_01750, partial [bacterium]